MTSEQRILLQSIVLINRVISVVVNYKMVYGSTLWQMSYEKDTPASIAINRAYGNASTWTETKADLVHLAYAHKKRSCILSNFGPFKYNCIVEKYFVAFLAYV
jgi:hypothetical protein